jgi:hypothetical protein
MKSKAIQLAMLVLLLGSTAMVAAQTSVVFDVPNAAANVPNGAGLIVTGINARGDVAGYFYDSSLNFKQRGFRRRRDGGVSLIDVPNASATSVRGINAGGDVAGYFHEGARVRGFIRETQGRIVVFDASSFNVTDVESISDSGDVAGMTFDSSNPIRGFVRDQNGAITVFDAPNAAATYVTGVNSRGEVIGYFSDTTRAYSLVGYARNVRGQFNLFDDALAFAINAAGAITGSLTGSSPDSGFIAEVNGRIVFYDGFDASGRSVNARGDVVGYLFDQNQNKVRGFVRHMNGDLEIFDAPNAADTRAECNNARGDIAGYFFDSSQANKARAFVRLAR